MDDDPAGLSGCVGPCRSPAPSAMRADPGAERPAALDLLSAPVFGIGSRGVLHHPPFQIGGDAAVLCLRLLENERLEFGGHPDGNRLRTFAWKGLNHYIWYIFR